MERTRCAWCCDGGLNQTYHDNEWGIPLHDDQKQFEFLMMEVMQCGLSRTLMLKKRGFKFLGSITVFSHLQACGIINDHAPDCWMYDHILRDANVLYIDD